MPTINVTVEKKIYVSQDIEITDEELELIKSDGTCPRFNEIKKDIENKELDLINNKNYSHLSVEYDYRIEEKNGQILIDWDD